MKRTCEEPGCEWTTNRGKDEAEGHRRAGCEFKSAWADSICKHQKAKRHRAQMVLLPPPIAAEREVLCAPPSEDEAELAKELTVALAAVAEAEQGWADAVSESEAMAAAHARELHVAQAQADARESRVAQARADAEMSRVVAMEAREAANAADACGATAQARADVALRLAGVYAD
ncbi:hypothetical protein T492DRAFT_866731 [Pavlovales sp. CCMP2436]|nr:hypothetical protein T492DRAFT_866731 [Pavlovales sp. CCMP2436]